MNRVLFPFDAVAAAAVVAVAVVIFDQFTRRTQS